MINMSTNRHSSYNAAVIKLQVCPGDVYDLALIFPRVNFIVFIISFTPREIIATAVLSVPKVNEMKIENTSLSTAIRMTR